jgi:hypothetical protein
MKDPAAAVQEILGEAVGLIRRRLDKLRLAVPHIVMAVTPEGEVTPAQQRCAGSPAGFGDDLKNVADELTAPPQPGNTTH